MSSTLDRLIQEQMDTLSEAGSTASEAVSNASDAVSDSASRTRSAAENLIREKRPEVDASYNVAEELRKRLATHGDESTSDRFATTRDADNVPRAEPIRVGYEHSKSPKSAEMQDTLAEVLRRIGFPIPKGFKPLGAADALMSAGTAGGSDALRAAINAPQAVGDVMAAGEFPSFGNVRDTAYERVDRNRPSSNLGSDVVGSILGSIYGAPGKAAKAANRFLDTGRGVTGIAKRASIETLLGASESAVTTALQGGDKGDIALDTGLGALISGASQLVLGEVGPRLVKGLVHGRKGGAIEDMLWTGSDQAALHSTNLRKRLETVKDSDDAHLLNLPVDPEEQDAAIHDLVKSINETDFPRIQVGKGGGTPFDSVNLERGIEHADIYRSALKQKIDRKINEVTRGSPTIAAMAKKTQKKLEVPRAMYDKMFSTEVPGQAGLKMLPGQQTALDFERIVSDKAGTPLAFRGDEAKYYNRALHLIRGHVTNPNARTVKMQALGDTWGPLDPTDFADVPVIALLKARKQIQRESVVGTSVNGTTVTKESARANKIVVDALDEMIGKTVGPAYATNKDLFAKVMREQEMVDQGHELFSSSINAPVGKRRETLREWMSNPNVSKVDKYNIRQGWRSGLVAAMEERGPLKVLYELLGDPADVDGLYTTNKAGEETLKLMVGEEGVKKVKEILVNDASRHDALSALHSVLSAKKKNPDAQFQLQREGDRLILTDPAMPGSSANNFGSIAYRGALTRELFQKGHGTARATLDLINEPPGSSSVSKLTKALDAYEFPSNIPAGSAAAVAATSSGNRQRRRTKRTINTAKKGIKDYLDSLTK